MEKWWQKAIVYQIYPRSFQDSDGDGNGDLRGILRRLDYLTYLGVNVLWLCPINVSPMRDNGYDIADYYHIDPSFGTDEDFECLLKEASARGMKVIMDLVVNHCSDRHRWFQDVLRNPDSPYASWFIIREGKDGREPNNLRCYVGGSAWERMGETDRFYFHTFSKDQPDLNWENPALRDEIFSMMEYWQNKGVAGFRVDAIGNLKKAPSALCSVDFEPDGEDGKTSIVSYVRLQDGIGQFLGEMRDRVFDKYDSFTVAEVGIPENRLEEYIGDHGYFSTVFDFSYTDIDVEERNGGTWKRAWTVKELKDRIMKSQTDIQKYGFGAPYLENHDQPRSVSKYIPEEEIGYESTTALAALYFFLRGVPFIYQGQEIGMTNCPFRSIDDFRDPFALERYEAAEKADRKAQAEGAEQDRAAKVLAYLKVRGRDHSRTPMQWSDEKYAGFSEAEPWIMVNPNYRTCNVGRQINDPDSILQFYRKMIRLRTYSRYAQCLTTGRFQPVETDRDALIAYRRELPGQTVTVLVNLSSCELTIPDTLKDALNGEVLLNNDHGQSTQPLTMKAYQVLVLGSDNT